MKLTYATDEEIRIALKKLLADPKTVSVLKRLSKV